MGAFLRSNPLPKELAHLEDHIRKLPVRTFLEFLISASLENMAVKDICTCIKSAAEFYSTDNHRCASCLNWSEEIYGVTILFDDKAVMLTVCGRCKCKVESGRDTPAMRRNIQSYVREGIEA